MDNLVDFSNCKVIPTYLYSGANGKKIGIEYENEIYMLKFPSTSKNEGISYSNSTISEYISCHIFESLGFETQKTILGTYTKNNTKRIVCACKDFTTTNYSLEEFAKLKNGVLLDSSSNGYGTELSEVLSAIDEQALVNSSTLKDFFWDMFIVDALLGNFDRHNGNWGLLINKETNSVKIAPIFDCGSCLYPQLTDEQIEMILKDESETDKRIYIFPNSALKINDTKINYFEFINSIQNTDCNNALVRIYEKIDLKLICDIVDNAPAISEIRKYFYKTMLELRFEKILKSAYEKLVN